MLFSLQKHPPEKNIRSSRTSSFLFVVIKVIEDGRKTFVFFLIIFVLLKLSEPVRLFIIAVRKCFKSLALVPHNIVLSLNSWKRT